MAISFNSIPADIRTPGVFVEIDNSRAVQGSPAIPNKTLVIGQRLAAGAVAAETPTQVSSAAKGENYFGHGSILAQMIQAYKKINPYTELWAIALDDEGAGVAATGTFTFGGTATEDGEFCGYIGGERIAIAVANADTGAVVAAAWDAAVTNYLLKSNLPVSSGEVGGVVTITCLHKGTLGNGIDLRVNHNDGEKLPAGITCSIVAMASGATDPDVADAITAMGNTWYNTIISSFADDTNQDKIEAELLSRWDGTVMKEAMSFIGAIGNQSALTALGNARNSQFTVLMGGGLSPTPAWIWACDAAAVDTYESDPARPRQHLILSNCVPPKKDVEFIQDERNTLLYDGVSTYEVDQAGLCRVERMITTYQTNALSVSDPSYLDITTLRTLARLRWDWRARVSLKFPRHKLANDGTNFGPGQAIVTPAILRAEALALFRDNWEPNGLVEGWEQFKTDLLVERDANDPNRVNLRMSPDLINQFRVSANQIQFLL